MLVLLSRVFETTWVDAVPLETARTVTRRIGEIYEELGVESRYGIWET